MIWDGVETDVTASKQAEEALRESEKRYSAIHNNAPFAIVLVKLPEGTISEINEAGEKMFEYSRQEIIGKTPVELGVVVDVESRARMHKEIDKHDFVRGWETRYRTR